MGTLDYFFIKYLESLDDEAHIQLLHFNVIRHLNESKQIGEYRRPLQLLIRLQVVEFEQKYEDFAELRNRQLSQYLRAVLLHQIDVHLTALGHVDRCCPILQSRADRRLQDSADRSKHPELRLSLRVSEFVVLYEELVQVPGILLLKLRQISLRLEDSISWVLVWTVENINCFHEVRDIHKFSFDS